MTMLQHDIEYINWIEFVFKQEKIKIKKANQKFSIPGYVGVKVGGITSVFSLLFALRDYCELCVNCVIVCKMFYLSVCDYLYVYHSMYCQFTLLYLFNYLFISY